MGFHDLLLPFATRRFLDPEITPASLLDPFRRILDIHGICPVPGSTYEGLLEALLSGTYSHISDLYPQLAYQDCPVWDARAGPYLPGPAVLSRARELFDIAKPWPTCESDELDNVSNDDWDRLYDLGKPALLIYCRSHEQAVCVGTPQERGWVVRSFFRAIQGRASKVVEQSDYPRLLRSLRVPLDDWPAAGQAPFGLLKRFSLEIGSQDRSFQVEDPVEWWHENEVYIPDLSEMAS